MPKIMVYPATAAAMNVHHHIDGKPKVGGCLWEHDGETCRALVDGWMTEDPEKQWTPEKRSEDASR
jgi:hypothetical protein